ncbi:hypothetical protein WMY93_001057 [Mugilogobius chulae]|uniref:Glomulin n=1 Tax=Mugilogobius chulae TaxID=88201 RepID=A0AAW0Q6X4_9GOBI
MKRGHYNKVGGSNPWFEGLHLLPLLRSVLRLPDGPETDLLQYMDRIMESLNLLRYLVIRDKVTENQTGIWTEMYKIEDTFLKPLRVGINMSRAHYERELLITKEDKKSKAKESSISVSVGEEQLPNMTSDTHIQALHSALHTFDMIESVLVRIEELIETGIWTEMYKIEDTFLKPLRVGINMSRAHYERELLITKEDKKSKAKESSISVSVGEEQLPNMTSDTHIQALHSALHTFDMIESVLVRIEELIEVKENA